LYVRKSGESVPDVFKKEVWQRFKQIADEINNFKNFWADI
jgi:hypothetical protein